MRTAIRDPAELLRLLGLSPEQLPISAAAERQFSLFVTREYLARIELGNPRDPLLLQVLPQAAEERRVPGFAQDPVQDQAASPLPGLIQKYQRRALLVVTGACAGHCRYCFRRHFPYQEVPRAPAAWAPALDMLRDSPEVREVILSGGDPLTESDQRLAGLWHELERITHVQTLRIHTRLPIFIPRRVTDALLNRLATSRFRVVIVIHANHARELDGEVVESLVRLRAAGALLLNQSVLLHGVNDSVAALVDLSDRLLACGVLPYYLHQLDRVHGAAHFEVTEERGRQLIEAMRIRLPGYAVPRYVREIAGQPHKTVLE